MDYIIAEVKKHYGFVMVIIFIIILLRILETKQVFVINVVVDLNQTTTIRNIVKNVKIEKIILKLSVWIVVKK